MTFQIDPMQTTGKILNLIAQKQKALGENLANVDTPGYVRKDVDFSQCLGSLGNPLETKMAAVLGSSNIQESATGEKVTPQKELIEMQKNSLMYSIATRRMSSIITEMKTVVNVGK